MNNKKQGILDNYSIIVAIMSLILIFISWPIISNNKKYLKREKIAQLPIEVENGYIKLYDRYYKPIFIKVDEIVAINDFGDNEISITTTSNGSIFGRFYVIGKSDKVLEVINTYNN